VPRQKPKYQVTLLEAQRRRLEALGRWFEFINDECEITPENFRHELLTPTYHALGGIPTFSDGPPSKENLAKVRQLIVNGFKEIAHGHAWSISLHDLGIVITAAGTSFAGSQTDLGQLGIAQLLRTEEWRIGACAWCGRGFLRKKQGAYCSPRCSQFVRTKRVRDPRWKRDEAKARKLRMTVDEFRTAERYPCPKCGAINRILRTDPGFACWKCNEISPAKFGEANHG